MRFNIDVLVKNETNRPNNEFMIDNIKMTYEERQHSKVMGYVLEYRTVMKVSLVVLQGHPFSISIVHGYVPTVEGTEQETSVF